MKQSLSLILIALAACSAARGWDFSGSNQAALWTAQPDYRTSYREYCDLRLSGALRSVTLTAGVRFLADQEAWDDPALFTGFSKRYLQVRTEHVTAQAGTYYATLGRGLVLNCVNEQAAKIDRDLEGLSASGSLEGWGEARVLMGRIRENMREIDTTRTYAGGEVKLTVLPPLTLGGAYLRANAAGPSTDPSFGRPVEESYSGSLGGTVGPVEWYGEYAGRRTYGQLFPTVGWAGIADVIGHGVYGSAALAVAGLGVTVDAKRYRRMDAAVSAPPPCNREGRLLNNGGDEQGFQADAVVTPWRSLEIHGNGSWAASVDDRPDVVTADLARFPGGQEWLDLLGEARWQASRSLSLNVEGRFRREDNLQSDIVVKRYKGATAGVIWTYAGSRTVSLKAGGNQYNNVYLDQSLDYRELLAELGWAPVPWLNVFATGDIADKRVSEYDDQKSWGELGCTVDLDNGRQRLKLSVGQTKGGLVCAGGFCRWEPAFRGIKAVWDWKF